MAKKSTTARTTARKSPSGKKAPSRKTKSSKGSSAGSRKSQKKANKTEEPVGEKEVTIDRRRPPGLKAECKSEPAGESSAPLLERRKKVNRRRQIDPTTCERDYSDEEIEFMNALNEYKRKSGRMFPTCSEVLEVIRDLGYIKLSPSEAAAHRAEAETVGPDQPLNDPRD